MTRLRPYLELIRLPAVFTAPADVLAGFALASMAGAALSVPVALTLLVASAASYCAGMAANDLFDLAVDRQERPGRPLPSGRVSVGAAWTLVLSLQGLALGLAATLSWTAVGAVAATIAATYAYNAALKDSLMGPLTMGACRYGNALIGAACLPVAQWTWLIWALPAGTALYVASLTFLSRHEVDGATRRAVAKPLVGMAVTAALPGAWPLMGILPVTAASAAVVVPLAWLARPLRRAWLTPGAQSIRGGVMAGIFGIAMVNAVLAAAAGALWAAAVAVALLVPGRLVGRWFYAT